MAISEAELKADIVEAFGTTPEDFVSTHIDTWWEMYAGKRRNGAPRLQYWYVMQHAIKAYVIFMHPRAVDFESKSREIKLHQQVETLVGQLPNIAASIAAIEKQASARQGGANGRITTRTPLAPTDRTPAGPPDASSMPYRGSPYERSLP